VKDGCGRKLGNLFLCRVERGALGMLGRGSSAGLIIRGTKGTSAGDKGRLPRICSWLTLESRPAPSLAVSAGYLTSSGGFVEDDISTDVVRSRRRRA